MKCVLVVVFFAAAASFSLREPANAADAPTPDRTRESAELESLRARAQGGDSLAQFDLGMAFAEGRNTTVDRVEALAWLTLAAEGGTTGIELGNLLVTLDGEQIRAAGRRLEAIRASNPGLRKRAAADASPASPRARNPPPVIAVPPNSTPPGEPQITRVVRPPANRPNTDRSAPVPVIAGERAESTASDDAAKWAAEKAALSAKNEQLARELSEARTQLDALRAAAAARSSNGSDTAARAREILALERSLAATREELAAAKTALAVADAQAKSAKSAQTPAGTEVELASLRRQVRVLEQDLQSATSALKRIAADKTSAETALAAANQRLAQAAKESSVRGPGPSRVQPTAAGADAKLAQVQSELHAAKARITDAEKAIAARDAELVKLRTATAAAATRQATTDSDGEAARRTAEDALQRLAQVTRELAEARKHVEAARPLESRLRELEAEKAAAANRASIEGVSKDDFARVVAARADLEQKLSTALQSYTLVTRERDDLRAQASAARELEARLRQLEAEKANLLKSNGDAASTQAGFAQIVAAKADAESKLATVLRSFTLLTKERDELRARVAELAKKVAAASGEESSRQK